MYAFNLHVSTNLAGCVLYIMTHLIFACTDRPTAPCPVHPYSIDLFQHFPFYGKIDMCTSIVHTADNSLNASAPVPQSTRYNSHSTDKPAHQDIAAHRHKSHHHYHAAQVALWQEETMVRRTGSAAAP